MAARAADRVPAGKTTKQQDAKDVKTSDKAKVKVIAAAPKAMPEQAKAM